MDPRTLGLVADETARALRAHGPMPADPARALAILVEEVGEVADAVLRIDRIVRDRHQTPDRRDDAVRRQRDHAISELAQVMAVASLMIDNLRDTGAAGTCVPAASVV